MEQARELLLDAASEIIASYREHGRQRPIGSGHEVTVDPALAA